MSFKSVFIIFLLISVTSRAQIVIPISKTFQPDEKEWAITNIIDSLINTAKLNGGGIICLNDSSVTIDTVLVSKVKKLGSDSIVVGKFLKKNQKKISSKEFWGVITTTGKGRRFYKEDMYLVWETPSPYIYEMDKYDLSAFYFSETLLSPLVLLNEYNVNNSNLDDRAKEVLRNLLDDKARIKEERKDHNRQVIAAVSFDLLSLILQVMIATGGNNYHSHHDYKPKPSTGPRTKR